MPKIIENLREKLMAEARRQIEESGYSAMTIRSVAKGCGVGTGTVYNYFESRDELIASFMLVDWLEAMAVVQAVVMGNRDQKPRIVCQTIYDQLQLFLETHNKLFCDTAAMDSFSRVSGRFHGRLRSQLAKPLEPFCDGIFEAEFMAESLLTWTVERKPFDEIYEVMKKVME